MKRVLPALAAVLLLIAVAAPASASAEAFRAAGPGATAHWYTQINGTSVETGLLVFRQNGSQGPLVMVYQQIWNGESLVSDTFGQARARVFVAPGLTSVATWPTVVTVTNCNGDYTACGTPFDIELPAMTWTGYGDISTNPLWTGPKAPPPFCISGDGNERREATLGVQTDPFGGALGEIGGLTRAYLFDVRLLWVSVKGGCF